MGAAARFVVIREYPAPGDGTVEQMRLARTQAEALLYAGSQYRAHHYYDDAIRSYGDAIRALCPDVRRRQPDLDRLLAILYMNRGNSYDDRSMSWERPRMRGEAVQDMRNADRDYREAIEMYGRLLNRYRTRDNVINLAKAHINVGTRLARLNEPDAASHEFQRAVALLTPLIGPQAGIDAITLLGQAISHDARTLNERGEREQAVDRFTEAIDLLYPLAEQDLRGSAATTVAANRVDLGITLDDMDQPEAASLEFDAAIEAYERMIRRHAMHQHLGNLARALVYSVPSLERIGRAGEARARTASGIALLERAVEEGTRADLGHVLEWARKNLTVR
jgi:tetratricopeptide (TPR) repeat protein